MRIVLDIPDNKAFSFIEVMKSMKDVKMQPLSKNAVELWDDLKTAAKDVKLHQQGKIKLKTAKELLDEL